MAPAVAAPDGVFAGCGGQQIVKLSRADLSPVWRIEAGEYEPFSLAADILILLAPNGAARGVDGTGRIAWSLEKRGHGWGRWRDRLFSVGEDEFVVAHPGTGEVEDRIRAPFGVYREGGLCGDVLVLQDKPDEKHRAFDLVRREFLWERPLLAEIKQTYGVSENLPILTMVEGGPGRFIGSRGGSLFGFSLDDGRLLWRAPVVVPYYVANVHLGRIYVWSYTNEPPPRANRFVCLDEATGEIVYDLPLKSHGGLFTGMQSPWPGSVGERHMAFSTDSGLIALFRLADGELVWSHEHNATAYRPAIDRDRLYVTTSNGFLLTFQGAF